MRWDPDYPITKISVSQISSKFIDVVRYCTINTKDAVGPLRDLVSLSISLHFDVFCDLEPVLKQVDETWVL